MSFPSNNNQKEFKIRFDDKTERESEIEYAHQTLMKEINDNDELYQEFEEIFRNDAHDSSKKESAIEYAQQMITESLEEIDKGEEIFQEYQEILKKVARDLIEKVWTNHQQKEKEIS